MPDDHVPESLDPVFRALFDQQWPYVELVFNAIDQWCSDNPDATRVPRALGDAEFIVGGCTGSRRMITFIAWMAQRPLEALSAAEGQADAWITRVGGERFLSRRPMNPQEMRDFRLVLSQVPA